MGSSTLWAGQAGGELLVQVSVGILQRCEARLLEVTGMRD